MISYSKAVQYATLFVPYQDAKDLVHNLYIHFDRLGMNLFTVSKRTVYVYMYNLHRNINWNSIENRNRYKFSTFDDNFRPKGANPEQILIGKELETTLSDFLRLKVEGYTQEEIGQKLGVSRRWVNKVINREIKRL